MKYNMPRELYLYYVQLKLPIKLINTFDNKYFVLILKSIKIEINKSQTFFLKCNIL